MAFTSFSLTLFVLNFAIHSSLLLFNVASSVQASSIFPNNRFLHHSTEQKISKFINDNLTQHLSTATGIQEPFNDLFSGDGADNLVFRDDIKDAIPEGDAPHKFPFIAEGLEWPVVNDERFPFSENEDRDWTSEEDDDSSYWPSLEDVDVDDKDDGDDDNKVWANEDDHPKWSTDYVIANLSSERRLQELSTLSALFVVRWLFFSSFRYFIW